MYAVTASRSNLIQLLHLDFTRLYPVRQFPKIESDKGPSPCKRTPFETGRNSSPIYLPLKMARAAALVYAHAPSQRHQPKWLATGICHLKSSSVCLSLYLRIHPTCFSSRWRGGPWSEGTFLERNKEMSTPYVGTVALALEKHALNDVVGIDNGYLGISDYQAICSDL